MCDQFASGLVTDLMEDALDHLMRSAVGAHLRICEVCASLLWRMRAVVGLIGRSDRRSDSDVESDRAIVAACLPLLAHIDSRRRRE
jgi:hypothetical protein